jgi:electron transfer flavoprotein beta subunit
MKIAVCISNVPDTTTRIRFDASKTSVDYAAVQWIINPWDELALTRALELKEKPGSPITEVLAITVGKAVAEPTLRKALAIGADRAVRIDAEPGDSLFTAKQLAAYFASAPHNLILTGVESADFNGSSVGSMLGSLLPLTLLSGVSGVELDGSSFLINREMDGTLQTLRAKFPMVLVVQKGIALVPRIPSMRGIMSAKTKPLTVVSAQDGQKPTSIAGFDFPPQRSACKMIDPENAGQVIDLLHNEAKVI